MSFVKCPICNKELRNQGGKLKRHVQKVHHIKEGFVCKELGCTSRFETPLLLKRHVQESILLLLKVILL
jgi:uncharacterized C2H2 Zn-finger protein